MDDLIGKVVDGYVLPCVLGEGASSVVFLGKKDGELRAIKVLKQGSVDSFFTEARRQQSIVHPNVVRVYDVIRNPPAIVMDFMEEGTLEDRLNKNDGSIVGNPFNAVNIAKEVVSGLIAIHDAGFVHRDIKPANILFNGAGVAKVGDLGVIARVDGAETSSADATIAGTLFYRAPEQRYGVGDARSDVYSVGRVLYKMLVGKLPSDTGTNHPMEVADVDSFLDMVVSQCLEVEPNIRFQSATELYSALDRLVVFSPMPVKAPSEVPVRVVDKYLNVRVSEILNSRGVTTNVGDPWINPDNVKKKDDSSSISKGALYLALLAIFGTTSIIRACAHINVSSSPSVSPSRYVVSGYSDVNSEPSSSGVDFSNVTQESLKSDYDAIGSIEKLLDCSDLHNVLSGSHDISAQDVVIYDIDGGVLRSVGVGVVLSDKGYVVSCNNIRLSNELVILGSKHPLRLSVAAYSDSDNLCLFRSSESVVDLDYHVLNDRISSAADVRISEDYTGVNANIVREVKIKQGSYCDESWKNIPIRWDNALTSRMFRDMPNDILPGTPVYNKSGALCGLLYESGLSSWTSKFNFIPAPKIVAFIDALRK